MKHQKTINFRFPVRRDRGVVTLAIGIILLLLITLVTLYGTRVTIMEQRISANDYRSREASSTAQAGLNYGIEFVKAHERVIRSTAADGWLDPDNPVWSDAAPIDCSGPPAPGSKERIVCDSGFSGQVRFYGAQDVDYDVPLNWPVSASKTLSDCSDTPEADDPSCRVAVELALCEFAGPPPIDCVDSGGVTAGYAVLVLARGISADGTAQASVRQILTPFELLPGSALPPLMAASTVEISGTLDVVVNPDGAGPGSGIPISGWANDDLQLGGNASFCYPDEYFQGNQIDITALDACIPDFSNQPCVASVDTPGGTCPMPLCADCDCPTSGDEALTKSEGSVYREGIDVVDKDGNLGPTPDAVNFPGDVFEYVFGIPQADYELLKEAANEVGDCTGIDKNSSGFYWVTQDLGSGDCTLSSGGGSPDGPLVLVVEGDFHMQGGGGNDPLESSFFGLVFAFSYPPDGIDGGTVNLRGGPEFYGVIVSDHAISISNGNFDMIYSPCMLDRIRSDDQFRRLGPVPGSWADHI